MRQRIIKVALTVNLVLQTLFTANAFASNGSLIWSQPISGLAAFAVANDSAAVYVVTDGRWIQKRDIITGNNLWSSVQFEGTNVYGIAVDSTGVYVAGDVSGGTYNYSWRVEKRSIDNGSLIWSQVIHPSGSGYDSPKDIAVDSTGVYVVGVDQSPNPTLASGFQWRIEKLNPTNGAVIWFKTENPLQSYSDSIRKLAIDGTGVYILGSYAPSGIAMRIEKRSLSTGNIIWAKDVPWPGPGNTYSALGLDSTGVYDGGYLSIPSGSVYDEEFDEWVTVYTNALAIEKRDISTGNVIWNKTEDLGTGESLYATAIAADASGVFVGGYGDFTSGRAMWLEKRNGSDGTLDWYLKGGQSPSVGNAYINDISLDSTNIYIAGWDINAWLLGQPFKGLTEKRKKTDTCSGPVTITWTDPTITANSTPIRATHITELRSWINTRRADAGLTDCTWTDPTITGNSTPIRATHITEMRTCIDVVYSACGQSTPIWTDPTITANTTPVRKIHIDELRDYTANAP